MNWFLTVFLLLPFLPNTFSEHANPYEAFLKELNELRATRAKIGRIPDMYKLVYDSSLESIASKSKSPDRSFLTASFDEFIQQLTKDIKLFPSPKDNSNQGRFEALVPLQKQIGCAKVGSSGYRCVLAPETEFKLRTPSKGKSEAGSGCQNEYRNSDGLCVYVGLETTFASRLNNIRRKFANRLKIMEMFEVKFDSKITSLANPKELTKDVINAAENQGFGFFKIPTYDIDEKAFEAEIKTFLHLSDTDKNKGLESSDGIPYGELISPSATIFGCQWDESQKCFQCFIGPRHSPYPILRNPLQILGTACPAGFKNDKGLCIQDETNPKSVLRIVNEARRTAAKAFEIGNMPELTWSEDLHQTVRNWDGKNDSEIRNIWNSEKYVNWRYDSSERATLQGRLAVFLINRKLNGPNGFTIPTVPPYKGSQGSIHEDQQEMEYLNPAQTKIGCAYFTKSGAAKQQFACLFGNNGNFERFDNSKGPLGSKCPAHLLPKDGLCVDIGDPEEFLKNVNSFRKDHANSYNITDMHELIWNDDLKEIAKHATGSQSIEVTKPYRYVLLHSYHLSEDRLKSEMAALKNLETGKREILYKRIHGSSFGISELAEPLQKFIGCSYKDQNIANGLLCVIGPREMAQPWRLENRGVRIPGTKKYRPFIPGSNCTAGYSNSEGLCTPINSSTRTLFGNQEDFIKDVNEYRRRLAKEYSTRAMFELYHSKDLETMLSVLDWDVSWPLARVSYRYLRFRSFNSVFDKIPGQFSDLKKLSQKERRVNVYESLSAGYLELLEPQQHLIACEVKKPKNFSFEKSEEFVVCALGPMGEMEMWGLTEIFHTNLAAACGDSSHFYQRSGLPQKFVSLSLCLKEIAKRATGSQSIAVTKPYRYVLLHSYHLSEDRLKSEMAALKNLGSSKREVLFKKIHDLSFGISELAEPLQKFIGCAAKDQEKADGLLCVIGPREILQPWRLENRGIRIAGTKSKYLPFIPGTNCSSGYSNSDGLCTPNNASTLSLFGTQEEFIENLNIYRRQLAKEYNTNWMFELYHSKDLQSMLDVLDWDVPWPLARVSFRYLRFRSFNSAIDKLPGEFTELKKLSQRERRIQVYQTNTTAGYLELLEPQQHLIACKVKSSEKDRFEDSKEFVVCLLGPMGEMEMWSLNEGFPFDRAAFCGDSSLFYQQSGMKQKFVGVDGLCTKTPESKVSYFGSRRWFLQQANLARKDRARRYATPDMMELIWDKELEESAKNLPYDSQKPPRLYNEGYRYMKLATYNWHLDSIKEQFFDHISFKDKNEVAKWIDKLKPTSMGILELFAKGQSKIGCAKRNTSAEMFILCLLGPKSEFNLIALEKEYVRGLPKKAGNRCPTGYQNDDGLCRRDQDMPPKKTKKRRTRTTTTSTSASSTTRKAKKSEATPWNVFCILLLTSSILLIMTN